MQALLKPYFVIMEALLKQIVALSLLLGETACLHLFYSKHTHTHTHTHTEKKKKKN